MNKELYGYACESCAGTVRMEIVHRELFTHRDGFVILENVPIGVCDQCGHRYYHSSLIRRVEEIATHQKSADRVEMIPVSAYV